MNCPKCPETRMTCKTTVSVGRFTRFRTYRCPECHHYEETFETSTRLLPMTMEEARAIREGIDKAKAARFRFRKNEGATIPVAAPSSGAT